MAQNPIQTVAHRLFHLEYRLYPEVALREALLNAFCHQDFRIPGPILVSLYPDRLEIGNPGGFIGGIAVNNLLHHRPVPRNPLLVDALVRLRLVNRLNHGIRRMFESMLIEGKSPPSFIAKSDAIRVVFRKQELSEPFRFFVAEEEQAGQPLDIDHLLILNHLLTHPEATTFQLAEICQRTEPEMRETLNLLETTRSYLERGGTGRGTYWALRPGTHSRLQGKGNAERDRRLDLEAAKARIHSVLLQRRKRGEAGLTNAEVRAITKLDRQQTIRLIRHLVAEQVVEIVGHGRGARYRLCSPTIPAKRTKPL